MNQSTNETTNESDFTSSVSGKTAILGAMLFAWQHTIAWVRRKTGTLFADVCFEVKCLKCLSNLVFTHLSNVDGSIYVTYFQQKDSHTK